MKRKAVILLVAVLLATGAGVAYACQCGTTGDTQQSFDQVADDAPQVKVDRQGTKFAPPVKAQQIPTDAWMCDMMGKVHYAALEKGDGNCPVCNMKLLQKE